MSPKQELIIGATDTNTPSLFLRHGRDNQALISPEMNNSLDASFLYEIQGFSNSASEYFKTVCDKCKFTGISVIHSPRHRSRETAVVCKNILSSATIPVDMHEEPLIRELYQGLFHIDKKLITQDLKYPPLVIAWKCFVQALAREEIDYHYGTPTQIQEKQDMELLNKYFMEYGESQSEFMLRIYFFLENLHQTDPHKMLLVVTHSTIIDEVQRVISTISKIKEQTNDFVGCGIFTKRLELLGERVRLHPAQAISMDLTDLRHAGNLLKKEARYIRRYE